MKKLLLLFLLFFPSRVTPARDNFIEIILGKKLPHIGALVGGSISIAVASLKLFKEKSITDICLVLGGSCLATSGILFWCGGTRSDVKNELSESLSALSNIKNNPKEHIKTLLIEPKLLMYPLCLPMAFAAAYYFRNPEKMEWLAWGLPASAIFLGVSLGVLDDWRSKIKISV